MANPLLRMVSSSQVSSWFGQGDGSLQDVSVGLSSAVPVPSRFNAPASSIQVQYLVVAGGGGGSGGQTGAWDAGGGGAGGVLEGTVFFEANPFRARSVTVGAGGAYAVSGSNSSLGRFVVAFGGGRSGGRSPSGGADGSEEGGSGGGGYAAGPQGNFGTPNQGNTGGNPGSKGGGGAGSSPGTSLNGGAGRESFITGTSVTRGGGGGAGSGTTGGTGGSGGGGNGGSNGAGSAGSANTGGGGGGGASNASANGGAGGSGIVILRYSDAFTITSSGLTLSTATLNGFKTTTITAGTGTVTFT